MENKNKHLIMEQIRSPLKEKKAVIAIEVGSGLTAKCCDIGGADIICVTSEAKMSMDGRPEATAYFANGDALEIVNTLIPKIRAVVKKAPLVVGVPAANPYLNIRKHIEWLRWQGIDGIVNSPSIGIWNEDNIKNYDNINAGFEQEIQALRIANEYDLISVGICRTLNQIERMLYAAPDIIVVNCGFTNDSSRTMEKTESWLMKAVSLIKGKRPDTLILCSGGPLSDIESVGYFLKKIEGLQGFYSSSVIEVQSVSSAIKENAEALKSIRLGQMKGTGYELGNKTA